MKRRQPQYHFDQTAEFKKRFARPTINAQTTPFSRCLLNHWELTKEAADYLSLKNKINDSVMNDKTNPQMALMIYTPNFFQKFIEQIVCQSPLSSYQGEPMQIQNIQMVIS